jgi:phosphate transport system substrate-binding protein
MATVAVGFWLVAFGMRCAGQSTAALRGAGATFPAPIYQKWIASFQAAAPGLAISYEPVGSEEGIRRLRRGTVDFAAADFLPDRQTLAEIGVRSFPSVAGAVVPAYNIHGLARDLRFTPELLAAIFSGRITKWNDPRIKEINRGVNLPAEDIAVVHRLDGSGTTVVFSSFLSKADPAWRDAMGAASTLHWPVGQAAQGNGGVAETLTRTPYSIGYLEFIYALTNELSYGAVQNAAGKFVRPDVDSIASAVKGLAKGETAAARDAYPIASFTWLLIPSNMPAGEKRARLAAFLDWAFSSGQREAGALGYVALPAELASQERSAASQFK